MNDRDRFRLLYGPYRPPRCKVGRTWLRCVIRGKMQVVGISDARISWPQTRYPKKGGRAFLIVCGDLVKAIKKESELAIRHWWGVGTNTVWTWRKSMGVGQYTQGTSRLLRDHWNERNTDEVKAKLHKALQSPERGAKISAARRGKPRPRELMEKLWAHNRGRKLSEETRRKMSEAHRHRGTLLPGVKPWKAWEDELVRTLPPAEAAKRTQRTLVGVYSRRRVLQVPRTVRSWNPAWGQAWTKEEDQMLGTMPDHDLAGKLQKSVGAVYKRRFKLGVPRHKPQQQPRSWRSWTQREDRLLVQDSLFPGRWSYSWWATRPAHIGHLARACLPVDSPMMLRR